MNRASVHVPNIRIPSRHGRRPSVSSLSSMSMTPLTPPDSLPLANSLPSASVEASPHEVLLFNPNLEISFAIEAVEQVIIESPVPASNHNSFSEMMVKINATDRDSFIRASEMTNSMQHTLRKLSAEDLRTRYRVTRSDAAGSKGLYTLQKVGSPPRERPRSLVIPPTMDPFGSLETPKSSFGSRSLLGMFTPKSASWPSLTSRPSSGLCDSDTD